MVSDDQLEDWFVKLSGVERVLRAEDNLNTVQEDVIKVKEEIKEEM